MNTEPVQTLLRLQSRRALTLAVLWGVLIFICAIYSSVKIISGNGFESNIFSLIPDDLVPVENQQVKGQLIKQVEQNFIVLLKGEGSAQGLQLAQMLKAHLKTVPDVTMSEPASQMEKSIKDFYFPYRYQLLSPQMRDQLLAHSPQQLAENRWRTMVGPISSYAPYQFEDDPFNLGGDWVQSIASLGDRFEVTEILSIKDGPDNWYLIRGELQLSPFNVEIQQRLLNLLDDFVQQQDSQSFELLTSGLVFHAAQGTKIAQSEVSTVGAGSLVAVILLVLIIFRSIQSFLFILSVLACSTLVALSVTWLIFGQVHLVTLAFGSTLLGLAADYCFHFLVKMRAIGNTSITRKLLFKGLVVSCLTSVAAYLIQLFSPFPGLQQFAVFVASGLVTACITVLVFGMFLKPVSSLPIPAGQVFDSLFSPAYRKIAKRRIWLVAIGLVIMFVALLSLFRQGVVDDVRLLNTSGSQLIESEQRVQQLLGNFSMQRYFLVEGHSSQQVLQYIGLLEKEIGETLQVDPSQLIVSPTSVVPSLVRQQADYQLIQEKIFSPQGAAVILCQLLQSDCEWLTPQPDFSAELSPEQLPQILMPLSPSLALLKNSTAVIFLRDEQFAAQIAVIDWQVPGVTYVDQVENLTSILKNFRQETSWLLAEFYLCLVIFSLFVFKRSGILVISAVTFSSVVALSVASGAGITLFHILALLLVIGITIDTAVFYITPGLDRDTWTAATLACLTSLIAFGLLSLSQVPLLSQFGLVVFVGLICAWLVTPLIYYLLETFHGNQMTQQKPLND